MLKMKLDDVLETIEEVEELGSRGIGDGADVLKMLKCEEEPLVASHSDPIILEAPEEFRCSSSKVENGIDAEHNGPEARCGHTDNDRVNDYAAVAATAAPATASLAADAVAATTPLALEENGFAAQDVDNVVDADGIKDNGNGSSGSDSESDSVSPSDMDETRVPNNGMCGGGVPVVRESHVESIDGGGIAICASAPGCSRVSDAPATVTPCAADTKDDHLDSADDSESETPRTDSECAIPSSEELLKDKLEELHGLEESDVSIAQRFVDAKNQINKLKEQVEKISVVSSKELNKRAVDARLRHLEEKLLRAAGVGEKKKQVVAEDYDANQNLVKCEDLLVINEFDVAKYDGGCYGRFGDDGFFAVYDELVVDDEDSDEPVKNMVGTDGTERKLHNPDRDNLKSLLKKPAGRRDAKKNRVVFQEERNEFFDADYIILIREDCDYDEEEDDGICTCNQHEMVRLTCCEPNCNCNGYGGYDPTPQSPKFAPPLEFVDAVTLSPPEGYKDMELGEQQLLALQQMARRNQITVCRECSQTHDDDGEYSEEEEQQSDLETEKTDQSQQTTPTTPPPADSAAAAAAAAEASGCMESGAMATRKRDEEQRNESPTPSVPPGGSPISGILKGGRLWKQQSVETLSTRTSENNHHHQQHLQHQQQLQQQQQQQQQQVESNNITSDDEGGGGKRSVRFIEADRRDGCDGAASDGDRGDGKASASPEPTEMTLTFKLSNHILISNNSLKPNSAVRQLFPCTKKPSSSSSSSSIKESEVDENNPQHLITAESLRAFEEAKKVKLSDADESIKKAIERNALRRSLIRYEPRKKADKKTDNSLVERIKRLTCDVDEPAEEQSRASPPGEESRSSPPEALSTLKADKSFSPSSSSSSNSSVASTYKKITDLFGSKRERPDIQVVEASNLKPQAPDLGGPQLHQEFIEAHNPALKLSAAENRKQFLATLGPLTACVGGTVQVDDYYYHTQGDRTSMASSVGTEYSLEDIEEGLKKEEDESKKTPPDVLAGTPSASEAGDELAAFVQQDAGRIERIKKKYQQDDEEDEHNDYGFNRRPSVRGIKPRFGSTSEILQQIQQQMQPPPTTTNSSSSSSSRNSAPVAWPYYSEVGAVIDNNSKRPNYQYGQYRPTSLIEESTYQSNQQLQQQQQQQQQQQRCSPQVQYRSSNANTVYASSPIMRVGGICNDYYQSLPRNRNGRPQSPPPQEVTKGFHQMMYIPYNHIEGFQPGGYYEAYARVTNQNQINKRYVEQSNYAEIYAAGKPVVRPPYNVVIARSESPQAYNNTARATQTQQSCAAAAFYQRQRYPNGVVWTDGIYKPRYGARYAGDNISLTDSESQHSVTDRQLSNGHFKDAGGSITNSPTKPRFIERGVPEGAASVSPQDGQTMTSPTSTPNSQQQQQQQQQKPLFYAMNV